MSDIAVGDPIAEIDEVSLDEGRHVLDEAARRELNMSGEEFIAAWDDDRSNSQDLWMKIF